jgi:membrane protein YdbS with pleckstrin-like domain
MAEAVYCHHCGARLDGEGAGGNEPLEKFQQTAQQRTGDGDDDDEQERTLWIGRYSPKAMLGRWVLSLLVTVALLVAGVYFQQGSWLWMTIAGLIVLLWLYQLAVMLYRQMSVRYHLTSQRFMHESGILSRTTDRIELIDIDDITFRQGLVERMVSVGTVDVSSSDRSHPELEMLGIENVRDVAQMIDDARRRERRRRGLHIESI